MVCAFNKQAIHHVFKANIKYRLVFKPMPKAHKKEDIMYAIFTSNGAMLTKFSASSFEQAQAIMEIILDKRPKLKTSMLFLSQIV